MGRCGGGTGSRPNPQPAQHACVTRTEEECLRRVESEMADAIQVNAMERTRLQRGLTYLLTA